MIPCRRCGRGRNGTSISARPLLYGGKTEGSTPFRFPSMSATSAIRCRRPDRRGQVRAAGADGACSSALRRPRSSPSTSAASIRAAALAMGGDWHDLGGGLTEGRFVSLQPLAHRSTIREARLGADWIAAILMREGVPITPEVKGAYLDGADVAGLRAGRNAPSPACAVLLQSNDLKQALRLIASAGLWPVARRRGRTSRQRDVRPFETEGANRTGAAPAVLPSYLFHRIGDRLDGRRRCSSSMKAGWRSTTRASPASSANG